MFAIVYNLTQDNCKLHRMILYSTILYWMILRRTILHRVTHVSRTTQDNTAQDDTAQDVLYRTISRNMVHAGQLCVELLCIGSRLEKPSQTEERRT